MSNIVDFPVSEVYLIPRYPIVPEASAPVANSLAKAYGQSAATILLALVLSVLLVFGIARLSGEPEVSRHAAALRATVPSEVQPVPTAPAVR